MPGFLPNRLNWVTPLPHPQASADPLPIGSKGETHAHAPAAEGRGDPIPTKVQTLWYSMYTISLYENPPSHYNILESGMQGQYTCRHGCRQYSDWGKEKKSPSLQDKWDLLPNHTIYKSGGVKYDLFLGLWDQHATTIFVAARKSSLVKKETFNVKNENENQNPRNQSLQKKSHVWFYVTFNSNRSFVRYSITPSQIYNL